MTTKSPEERRKALLDQKAQLEQRLKALDGRLNEKKRKDDTRRKVIVGAICLQHAEKTPEFKKSLVEILKRTLTKPAEKALFTDLLGA